jgi:transglutaminase-like putative cysteine protease
MSTALPDLPRIVDERPGLQRLSWVLIALGAVLVPMSLHLPVGATVFAVLLGVWRLVAEQRGWRMLPDWLRLAGALAGLLTVLLSFRTINGAVAGSALLVIMMALKLTETTRVRDCVLLVFLGYFLVLAELFYSQEIWIVLWLSATVWLLTAVLLAVNHTGAAFRPRAALRTSGALLAAALPIVIVMFILFPRVPGPLWGAQLTSGDAVSGLGDSMEPGSISRLTLSDEVAFRVEVLDGQLPARRYWRGPTLPFYDGRSWRGTQFVAGGPGEVADARNPVRYAITAEPHLRSWLIALEMPITRPADTRLTNDFLLAADRPLRQRRRYELTSATSYRAAPVVDAERLARATSLPAHSNPRTRALADAWRAAHGDDDAAVVEAALRMFREQPFRYTLAPPLLDSADSIDQFLYQTQAGFCEHYAGAFGVLMRAANIPTRVVTGYLGGEYNEVGGYWIVRQSDAHAWTEVWLNGQGWVRVDPTAAIAPERVERGLDGALEAGESAPGAMFRNFRPLYELRLRWDAIDNGWNQWVLAYGPELQQDLLAWLGVQDRSWQRLALWMGIIVAALLSGLALRLAWLSRPRPPDAVQRAWLGWCAELARAGLVRAPHEGPLDFARRAARQMPAERPALERVAEAYALARYGWGDERSRAQFIAAARAYRAPR